MTDIEETYITCSIDFDMATASTGTTDLIRRRLSKGVKITKATVVKLVRRMLKATSPLLSKLAYLHKT